MDTALYGSAVAMDTKNNYQIGWSNHARVSHRFRAGTTAALTSVAVNLRGGRGYSGGDGGTIRITVETDEAGRPSGTILAAVTFAPGNPGGAWEKQDALPFKVPAELTLGTIYHVVLENVSPSPVQDYISVNEGYTYDSMVPRQPLFSDDFAVLHDEGDGWVELSNDTPVMDLTYADGHHDGNAYFAIVADYYAVISGDGMARERFTVSGSDRTVTTATVRVKRVGGSSPLAIALETSDGTDLALGSIDAGQIRHSRLPTDEASLAGSRWVTATFAAPVTLTVGQTYDLRLSTAADTKYVAIPLREQDATNPAWGSQAFRDGEAQSTSDGSFWHPVYRRAPLDFQFYLR